MIKKKSSLKIFKTISTRRVQQVRKAATTKKCMRSWQTELKRLLISMKKRELVMMRVTW